MQVEFLSIISEIFKDFKTRKKEVKVASKNETKDSLPQQQLQQTSQRGSGQSRKIETTIIISEIRSESAQQQAKASENSSSIKSTTNKQSTKTSTSTSVPQSSSGVMTGAFFDLNYLNFATRQISPSFHYYHWIMLNYQSLIRFV